MSKLSRQKAILDLLDEGPVASQEELQKLLHRRGLDAGQATLSRDIRELGLVKSAGGYSLPQGSGGRNGLALGIAPGARVCDQCARRPESARDQDQHRQRSAGGRSAR